MPKTKRRVKAKAEIAVPQDHAEANRYMAEIGEAQRSLSIAETGMNAALAEAKAKFEERAAPFKSVIKERSKGLQIYCEGRRDTLTNSGRRKFFRFAAGRVSWRTTPPKVGLRNVKAVIAAIKAAGKYKHFLRLKEEVDKEAMLKRPDLAREIAGVTISQTEEFVIEPADTKLEEIV